MASQRLEHIHKKMKISSVNQTSRLGFFLKQGVSSARVPHEVQNMTQLRWENIFQKDPSISDTDSSLDIVFCNVQLLKDITSAYFVHENSATMVVHSSCVFFDEELRNDSAGFRLKGPMFNEKNQTCTGSYTPGQFGVFRPDFCVQKARSADISFRFGAAPFLKALKLFDEKEHFGVAVSFFDTTMVIKILNKNQNIPYTLNVCIEELESEKTEDMEEEERKNSTFAEGGSEVTVQCSESQKKHLMGCLSPHFSDLEILKFKFSIPLNDLKNMFRQEMSTSIVFLSKTSDAHLTMCTIQCPDEGLSKFKSSLKICRQDIVLHNSFREVTETGVTDSQVLVSRENTESIRKFASICLQNNIGKYVDFFFHPEIMIVLKTREKPEEEPGDLGFQEGCMSLNIGFSYN